jgi:transcriptional regulator of acetoin/glycerol metabolism
MAALMLHDWPGNVRELENAIEHGFVLCQEGIIRLHHLPARVVPRGGLPADATGLSLKEAEKRTILAALERNRWKKVATARELGIDKNTLRRKIQRLGIVEPRRQGAMNRRCRRSKTRQPPSRGSKTEPNPKDP